MVRRSLTYCVVVRPGNGDRSHLHIGWACHVELLHWVMGNSVASAEDTSLGLDLLLDFMAIPHPGIPDRCHSSGTLVDAILYFTSWDHRSRSVERYAKDALDGDCVRFLGIQMSHALICERPLRAAR